MKKLLLYILILFYGLCYAQNTKCALKSLYEDLDGATKEFNTIVRTNKGFEAYKVLHLEATGLRTNINELNLVSRDLKAIEESGGYLKWKNLTKGVDDLIDAKLIKELKGLGGEFYRSRP